MQVKRTRHECRGYQLQFHKTSACHLNISIPTSARGIAGPPQAFGELRLLMLGLGRHSIHLNHSVQQFVELWRLLFRNTLFLLGNPVSAGSLGAIPTRRGHCHAERRWCVRASPGRPQGWRWTIPGACASRPRLVRTPRVLDMRSPCKNYEGNCAKTH